MTSQTILLVDYQPRNIIHYKTLLERAGYEVQVARDGVSAVSEFSRLRPDLVLILEAMIPKKHGFEVCGWMKRTSWGKRTPVIISTTVYRGRRYRTEAIHKHGCDEYIERPCGDDLVLETVRRLLTESSLRSKAEEEVIATTRVSAPTVPPPRTESRTKVSETTEWAPPPDRGQERQRPSPDSNKRSAPPPGGTVASRRRQLFLSTASKKPVAPVPATEAPTSSVKKSSVVASPPLANGSEAIFPPSPGSPSIGPAAPSADSPPGEPPQLVTIGTVAKDPPEADKSGRQKIGIVAKLARARRLFRRQKPDTETRPSLADRADTVRDAITELVPAAEPLERPDSSPDVEPDVTMPTVPPATAVEPEAGLEEPVTLEPAVAETITRPTTFEQILEEWAAEMAVPEAAAPASSAPDGPAADGTASRTAGAGIEEPATTEEDLAASGAEGALTQRTGEERPGTDRQPSERQGAKVIAFPVIPAERESRRQPSASHASEPTGLDILRRLEEFFERTTAKRPTTRRRDAPAAPPHIPTPPEMDSPRREQTATLEAGNPHSEADLSLSPSSSGGSLRGRGAGSSVAAPLPPLVEEPAPESIIGADDEWESLSKASAEEVREGIEEDVLSDMEGLEDELEDALDSPPTRSRSSAARGVEKPSSVLDDFVIAKLDRDVSHASAARPPVLLDSQPVETMTEQSPSEMEMENDVAASVASRVILVGSALLAGAILVLLVVLLYGAST